MEYTAEVTIGLRRSISESLSVALSKLTKPIEIPKKLQGVVIKPSIYDPRLIGNTNVEVVKAVIHKFESLGPVSIVESDNPLRTAWHAFAKSGYNTLVKEGVDIVNLSDIPTKTTRMPGYYFKEHSMPSLLFDSRFFINVPTIKSEPDICTIGAGIKNLFGLLPEVEKHKYHERIDDILLDILSVIRPHLTIVDLTKLVIGKREDGKTRDVGAVLVGRDPVAVDAVCADLLGIDPLEISHLSRAYELSLGEAVLDRIQIIGTEEQKAKLFKLCRL